MSGAPKFHVGASIVTSTPIKMNVGGMDKARPHDTKVDGPLSDDKCNFTSDNDTFDTTVCPYYSEVEVECICKDKLPSAFAEETCEKGHDSLTNKHKETECE